MPKSVVVFDVRCEARHGGAGMEHTGSLLAVRLLEEHLEEYIPQLESTGQESPDTGKR